MRCRVGAAAASGAGFIRVNVHTGAMVTDQGLIQGRARETLLYRARLDPALSIAADVLVKHASPLGAADLRQVARDTWRRGRADALIITGSGTGRPSDPADLRAVREAVPEATLWVGSGVTHATAAAIAPLVDGAIIGTALHEGGDLAAPLALERIRRMVALLAR